ncbi:disulfide bond formation protein B [Variovorax sp. RO1]|uniref:disulfide bond formation protein B n=1 Tax=Variovorax sp. RO1 TaxID=2066034 RepID=UPI000C716474|nr:disulfide bond formation protein B [Variovorax sp. RO1]PLC05665.1 disulfide bond formation protein B [Variovorax sp. RO1]
MSLIVALPKNIRWTALFVAWLIALTSTLGALFLGEVMGLTPCVLCWYQRIAMFPLVVILGMGLLSTDFRSARYGIVLALAGWVVALFHCLLYWGVVPKSLVPCGQGASCTDGPLTLAGLLSIPLLSLMAFTLILISLFVVNKGARNE